MVYKIKNKKLKFLNDSSIIFLTVLYPTIYLSVLSRLLFVYHPYTTYTTSTLVNWSSHANIYQYYVYFILGYA